ncbi:MAG: glycosyltransferase family 1 protein [Patescibacteria group bacterium]
MKIGINARNLLAINTNHGQYTIHLLQEFDKMNLEHEFFLFVPTEPKNINFSSRNFHLIIVPEKVPPFLSKGFAKLWWEQSLLPTACEKLKIDFFHSLYAASSIFTQKYPVLTTMHDTIPWKLPSYHRRFTTRVGLNFTKKGLKKSDRIVAVSINTKLDIASLLDYSYPKISVLPNGIPENFTPELSIETREFIKTRYNLTKPFIFYTGGFDKRKNLKRLIEAFSVIVNEKGISDYDLVIAGSIAVENPDNLYYEPSMLNSYSSELGLKNYVKFIGAVPENDLVQIYKMCEVFAYPTLFEGFGLPVAEAFATATPVVTSYTGSMMEICKNGAIFVDPFNPSSIADGILEILQNKNLSSKIAITGFEMSKIYNWSRIAKEYIKIYELMKTEWDEKISLKKAKMKSSDIKKQIEKNENLPESDRDQ